MYHLYLCVVPVQILDSSINEGVRVQEGDNVTLVCNATGTPTPEIHWYRLWSENGRQLETERMCIFCYSRLYIFIK